jgi:hypothetical protein
MDIDYDQVRLLLVACAPILSALLNSDRPLEHLILPVEGAGNHSWIKDYIMPSSTSSLAACDHLATVRSAAIKLCVALALAHSHSTPIPDVDHK